MGHSRTGVPGSTGKHNPGEQCGGCTCLSQCGRLHPEILRNDFYGANYFRLFRAKATCRRYPAAQVAAYVATPCSFGRKNHFKNLYGFVVVHWLRQVQPPHCSPGLCFPVDPGTPVRLCPLKAPFSLWLSSL